MPRIDQIVLDLHRSLNFQKEEWLEDLVASLHITPEEFARLYVLEEYPMEMSMADFTDFDIPDNYVFSYKQEFHIRRKTLEEMLGDQSHIITQGENDGNPNGD